MAKTSKLKKNPTANPRSRASKRATSPSIDVDKSIIDAPRASDATPILAARLGGGVTKPKRKQKPLTRGQRRRQEKGLVRAEIVQDRMSKKVNDASSRLKKMRERKGMWDEVNGTNSFDKLNTLMGEEKDLKGDEWVDEMEEVDENTAGIHGIAQLPATAAKTTLVVVDRTASAPTTSVEDETEKIT